MKITNKNNGKSNFQVLLIILLISLPTLATASPPIKVFNTTRIVNDIEQVIQFVDSDYCKYVGEISKDSSKGLAINVKQKVCRNKVEKINRVAYPEKRSMMPIPVGESWILIESNKQK